MERRQRRSFTDDYKQQAVGLVASSGRSVGSVAKELGLRDSVLRRWVEKAGMRHEPTAASAPHNAGGAAVGGPGRGDCPVAAGERAAAYGKGHFKKVDCNLFRNSAMSFCFIEDHRDTYPVQLMCSVLEVSPAGYYAWRSRPQSARSAANCELLSAIKQVHQDNHGRYGSPRIHIALQNQGRGVSRGRIERLMRRHGMR